jgi:ArsR family transcriptional regulator, arsenate/arsenite/antimonite-responsive transcriptional repressor
LVKLYRGRSTIPLAVYAIIGIFVFVQLIGIYQCLCDETRLRILHLLTQAPLCVCHFQTVLKESQVNISKHLRYLKAHGLVEVKQHRNWRIYQLPGRQTYELRRHLRCLQDCVRENKLFREDLKRLRAISAAASSIVKDCCAPSRAPARRKAACC